MGLEVGRHVVFPFGQALPAARDLWALAAALEAHQVQRGVAAAHAREDWLGLAHDHFEQIIGTEEADTAAVADGLRARARLIAGMWAQAYGQENRVLWAEDVNRKIESDGFWENVGEWFAGEDDYGDPPPDPAMPEPPDFPKPPVDPDFHPGGA
jgi:hypothetical protein